MSALVLVALLAVNISIPAYAEEVHEFNISAPDAPTAIHDFALQAGVQILATIDTVKDKHFNPVLGQHSTDEGLVILLSGTGLTHQYMGNRAVAVVAQAAGAQESSDAPYAKEAQKTPSLWDRFRLAGVDQETATSAPASVEKNAVQDSERSSMKLEEVIVSAQKRDERLIDVPISIVAISGDQLQQRQITSMEDLAATVPGLSYTNGGGSIHYWEIRGISNNAAGTSSQIGLYIDEADVTLGGGYSAPQINAPTYDLERAEVLRGPQGTLYGEGSAGGTVRLITKSPSLTRFSFESDIAALWTQDGSPSERVSAVANMPLIENQLALRVTGTFNREGGWIDQPAADRKDINGEDLTNVRAKLLWKPTSQLTVSAMAILNRDDRGVDVSDRTAPNIYTQVFSLSTTPRVENNWELYHLLLTYDFSFARLVSATSYLKSAAPWFEQGFSYQFTPPDSPPPFNEPYSAYAPIQTTIDRSVTQELRLSSRGSSVWQWTLGAFYKHYRDTNDVPVNYYAQPGPAGSPLPAPYGYSSSYLFKQASAFVDTNYRVWDRLTLGAGVRYFRDDQNLAQEYFGLTEQTGRFNSVDPRIYAQFKLTPDANLYASAAKGFRSGGFNSFGFPTFGPENVWTYELGTKMTVQDGHVSLDTAVFLSNYTDYLAYGVIGTSQLVTAYAANVGKARIKGVETDLVLRPTNKWRFDLSGSYVNARFTELDATQTAYNPGDPLDLVPRYQLTVTGQRDFSWGNKAGFVQLDYSRTGPETSRNRSLGPWYYGESDTINRLNFNSSLFLNSNLRVGVFAQNLINEQGYVNPLSYYGAGVRLRPRTYGVDFSVTFQ